MTTLNYVVALRPIRYWIKDMKKTLSLSAIMLMTTSPAFAQDVIYLDEIVVSASSLPRAKSQIGVQVETLNDSNSENLVSTASSWMGKLPGVSVTTNGSFGSTAGFRIRGLSGYYTPVYVDGIDLSDNRSPQNEFNWGPFSSINIKSAEVLKGSQSSLYGSGAVAGVVNMATWKPEILGLTSQISSSFGTFNSSSNGLSVGFLDEKTELSLSLSEAKSDGFSSSSKISSITKAKSTEQDGFTNKQITLGARYHLDFATVGYGYFRSDSKVETDAYVGDDLSPDNDFTTNDVFAHKLYVKSNIASFDTTLSASKVFFDGKNVLDGSISSSKSTRTNFKLYGSRSLNERSDITLGLEHIAETYNSSEQPSVYGYFATNYAARPVTARNSRYGVFAEYNNQILDSLDINFLIRNEQHSQAGGQPSGRIALNWAASETITLKGSAATGYRAPSIYELNSLYNGNNSLKSEKSNSYELTLEKKTSDGSMFSLTSFQTEVTGKIEWKPNTNYNDFGIDCYEAATDICHGGYNNTENKTLVKGVEIGLFTPLASDLSASANYTYTEAKDSSGNRLKKVPLHKINVGLDYSPTENLKLRLDGTRVVDRLDYNAMMKTVAADNYTVINFNLGYDINSRLKAHLNIENLLDEKYESSIDFNSPGRTFFAGIRASF